MPEFADIAEVISAARYISREARPSKWRLEPVYVMDCPSMYRLRNALLKMDESNEALELRGEVLE